MSNLTKKTTPAYQFYFDRDRTLRAVQQILVEDRPCRSFCRPNLSANRQALVG